MLATAPSAYADSGPDRHTGGGVEEDAIYAEVSRVTFDHSNNGTGDAGPITVASNIDWQPPPCWYAPLWDPKEFKRVINQMHENVTTSPDQPSYAKNAVHQLLLRYKDEKYKNFNLDKQGDGKWWGAVENPNEPDVLKRMACNDKLPFWVATGETPQVEEAIDPEVLAELAYQQIRVPSTEVELNPSGEQTVNLATWAWLDSAKFKPVSVTASLDALGIEATTTAKPVALEIDAGTPDAELHPSSGTCRINDDGSIGAPYTKGNSGKTPPCGLTYLRSSGDGTYQLQATLTWKVSWEGTGVAGGDLPDGTFESTQDVTVQEIQSIVR